MSDHSKFRALTIAGSDSGGGAGIQADLKTFAALGVYGLSVVTNVTAQNTIEVAAIAEVPDEVVIAQIDTVLEDIGADAVKIGMLGSVSIVQNTADRLEAWGIPHLVIDPVMISKSGAPLLQPDAVAALKKDLLPLATVVTPNIAEAEVLAGRQIASPGHLREAAKAIRALGPNTVIIKGGNLDGPPVDLVYHDGQFTSIEGDRIKTTSTYGAGCTFSSAIAALLARGLETIEAIHLARTFVVNAMSHAKPLGEGRGPLNHSAPLPEAIERALCGVAVRSQI
jgi:hydroxymethylpyrimidine/phosphomethylpyrimidine kinase